MRRAGHRTVPHTADVTVQAWGATREQCLAQAVAGLVACVLDTAGASVVGRHAFRLEGASDAAVLRLLLDEVVFLLDARGQVPVRTHVEGAGPGNAHGWFEVADATRAERVGSVPKGVSLSGLALDGDAHGWRCSATIDV